VGQICKDEGMDNVLDVVKTDARSSTTLFSKHKEIYVLERVPHQIAEAKWWGLNPDRYSLVVFNDIPIDVRNYLGAEQGTSRQT
jgi:hypothetical protein